MSPSSSPHSPIAIIPTGTLPSPPFPSTLPTGIDRAGHPVKFASHTYVIAFSSIFASLTPPFNSLAPPSMNHPAFAVVGVTSSMPGCCCQRWARCCINKFRIFWASIKSVLGVCEPTARTRRLAGENCEKGLGAAEQISARTVMACASWPLSR